MEKWTQEHDRVVSAVTTDKLLRHSCQLFYKTEQQQYVSAECSGVLVVLNESHFIVTASHAVDAFYKGHLFFKAKQTPYQTAYIQLTGELRHTKITHKPNEPEVDLAIIKLSASILSQLSDFYSFLPFSKMLSPALAEGATNYCILGFPESDAKRIGDFLQTKGEAFYVSPSKANVYDYYRLDPRKFYSFEIRGKGIDLESGLKVRTNTNFHGMSGGGIWALLPQLDEGTCDYYLIGIVSEFRKGRHFCLFGNRVSLISRELKRLAEEVS